MHRSVIAKFAAVVFAANTFLVAVVVGVPAPPAVPSQVASEVHRPPVDAPIADPFREPEHAFGPGNRGIEYASADGGVVVASAEGSVSFAGTVAGNRFVTIDHGDGLVTTVGFLEEVLVSRGEVVLQGQALGISARRTHFSARQDGEYFDPALLFERFVTAVRLVPTPN